MMTERPFAELNLWQRILAEHWDSFRVSFRAEHGREVPEHWQENVERMLGCGVHYFDTKKLRRKWQYHVLTALRRAVRGTARESAWHSLLGTMFTRYPAGFDCDVMPEKGPVEHLIAYLCKYMSSPPVSIRRIEDYDGANVTYRYEAHRRGLVRETLPAAEFIHRMVRYLPPKGYRMVRYYGIYARPLRARMHRLAAAALRRLGRAAARVATFVACGKGTACARSSSHPAEQFGDHRVRCRHR